MGHQGLHTVTIFADGELLVTVQEDVDGKDVWVIASMQAPAENIIELLLLLDALQRMNATINLLVTYFGYARQDRYCPGEPLSAYVILNCLKQYTLRRFVVVSMHSFCKYDSIFFESYIPLDFFQANTCNAEIIVAPDSGAFVQADMLAHMIKKPLIIMNKKRAVHDNISQISYRGSVKGKKILIIDDMISTASTLLAAAELFKNDGAAAIYCAVVHGIFSATALKDIEKSSIDKLWVTNTVDQKYISDKISVFDIGPSLLEIVISSKIRI